jgi:adenylate cyclase
MMYRLARSLGLGMLVAATGLLAYFGLFGFDLEENLGLDLMMKARGQLRAPEDVVVVTLDKPATDRLGLALEPEEWPRSAHARLVDRLAGAGARVIAFDILFREAREATQDRTLAEAIERAGNVILFAYLRRERLELPVPGAAQDGSINLERLVAPTPVIAASAAALAPFALPKNNVKLSQFWTFRRSAGDKPTLPAMALQLYTLDVYETFVDLLHTIRPQVATGRPHSQQEILRDQGLPQLMDSLKSIFVAAPDLAEALQDRLESDPGLAGDPVRRRRLAAMIDLYSTGNLHYLNFYGPPRSVTTVSYSELLQDRTPPAALFSGKAVFVGYSAGFQPDQKDGFYTTYSQPDGLDISGVEVAATAFANLLDRSAIRPPAPLQFVLIIIAYGLLAGVLSWQGSALASVGLSVLLPVAYGATAFTVFTNHQLWLPVAVPGLVQSPLALVTGLAIAYRQTRRDRNRIRQAFGHYIPDRVVDQLLRSSGAPDTHRELRYGICLATDAEQYTRLAEAMAPDALHDYMNRYYATLFEPVRAHRGIVSDVIGDAMLAIWSASDNDSALRAHACRAAVEIVRSVDGFNRDNERPLPTRIGLHAGELTLGNVGALDHFEYRAVGDIVNTASRIQGINKLLQTRIVVSPMVLEGVTGFATRELGSFQLVGKQEALTLHELIGEVERVDADLDQLLTKFAQGLAAYRERDWRQALALFKEILQTSGSDGPTRFYFELCKRHVQQPPPQPWSPIISLRNK